MNSENEKRPSSWKCLLVFLLALSVWMIGLAATDGGLHQFAHGGTDCEPSGLICAIALFGAGALDTAPGEIVVSLPANGFQERLAPAARIFPAPQPTGAVSARGPPHFLIQI